MPQAPFFMVVTCIFQDPDGVRPRGVHILAEILKKAFAEAGITDVQYESIVS
jgi:hypothetical protein